MSKEFGGIIIGADQQNWFSGWFGELGVHHKDSKSGQQGRSGNWLKFSDGILIAVYKGTWNPIADPGWLYDILYKKDSTLNVITEKLNLRTGAGSSFEINGDPIIRDSALKPTGKTSTGWLEVNTSDGRTGWVNSKHTTPKYDEY